MFPWCSGMHSVLVCVSVSTRAGMYTHERRGQRTASNIVTQVYTPSFSFPYLKTCIYFGGGECMPCICGCLKRPEEGTRFCVAGVTGYELPGMGAGHLTWVLWKKGELFQPLSCLSRPTFLPSKSGSLTGLELAD